MARERTEEMMKLELQITAEQVQSLMNESIRNGALFTLPEAESFLDIFALQLRVALHERFKTFVEAKMR